MGATMAKVGAGLAVAAALATAAQGETVGFDRAPAGAVPAGWVCGSIGGGAPRLNSADPSIPASRSSRLLQHCQQAFAN